MTSTDKVMDGKKGKTNLKPLHSNGESNDYDTLKNEVDQRTESNRSQYTPSIVPRKNKN